MERLRHDVDVLADHEAQSFGGRVESVTGASPQTPQLRQGHAVALVQDGFLVREVVVQRRLPHADLSGDVVERDRVVSPLPERSKRCSEDLSPALALLGRETGRDGENGT